MSLDVGVVKIRYLDTPKGAAYRFAQHLSYSAYEADWEVSSGENTIVEYEHGHLLAVADEYATSQGLNSEDKAVVRNWVQGLPWEDGMVMLHLG